MAAMQHIHSSARSEFDIAINAQAVLGLVLDTIFDRTPEPFPDGPDPLTHFDPNGNIDIKTDAGRHHNHRRTATHCLALRGHHRLP